MDGFEVLLLLSDLHLDIIKHKLSRQSIWAKIIVSLKDAFLEAMSLNNVFRQKLNLSATGIPIKKLKIKIIVNIRVSLTGDTGRKS